MFKHLLLTAAFALLTTGAAQASTLLASGVISNTDPPGFTIFTGDEEGGFFRFRSSEKRIQTWLEVDPYGRFYSHTRDEVYRWGSTSYLQIPIPAFIYTERSDGFSIFVDLPKDTTIYSDGCVWESCGIVDISQYMVKIFLSATFAPGSEGKTWTLERVTTSTVPEPATWAMMIAGFGLIGATLRSPKRRQLHRGLASLPSRQ